MPVIINRSKSQRLCQVLGIDIHGTVTVTNEGWGVVVRAVWGQNSSEFTYDIFDGITESIVKNGIEIKTSYTPKQRIEITTSQVEKKDITFKQTDDQRRERTRLRRKADSIWNIFGQRPKIVSVNSLSSGSLH